MDPLLKSLLNFPINLEILIFIYVSVKSPNLNNYRQNLVYFLASSKSMNNLTFYLKIQ